MNRLFLFFTLWTLAFPLPGWTQEGGSSGDVQATQLSIEVQRLVQNSLRTLEATTNYADWKSHPQSPEQWLEDLQKRDLKASLDSAFCSALEALPAQDLMIYTEVLEETTAGQRWSCRNRLHKRIDDYLNSRQNALMEAVIAQADKPDRNEAHKEIYDSEDIIGPSLEVELDTAGGPRMVRGDLKKKEIALTFDDGPHSVYTPRLLKILEQEQVHAVFFVVGKNADREGDTLRKIVKDGHIPAVHSYSHAHLPGLTLDKAFREIESGFEAVLRMVGICAPFFRFPYGASTETLRTLLKQDDIAEFFWSIDTLDWKKKDPVDLLNYALTQTLNNSGGIALFHDIQPQTIAMMPHYLKALREKGYTTVVYKPKSWIYPPETPPLSVP